MQKGDRAGAVLSMHGDTINLLGFGIYEGKVVPPSDADGLVGILGASGIENPKITLDSGEVVWGCQCWWGSEEEIKKWVAESKIINQVSLKEE